MMQCNLWGADSFPRGWREMRAPVHAGVRPRLAASPDGRPRARTGQNQHGPPGAKYLILNNANCVGGLKGPHTVRIR
jgi:hypothetical protein